MSESTSLRNSTKNQTKFDEGEKILCFHGDLIYEAKCLKIDLSKSNEKFYLVHYNGWNKNWDEWVMISRILKHTEDNVRRQQELLIQCRFSARKMKALTQSKKEDPRELKRDNFEIGGNDSKKSKKLDDTELNYDKNIKQETHKRVCVVDIYSKEWLIDDFDAIMQQNKLVKVPSTKSVRSILSDYKKTIKNQEESKDAKSSNELDETINGLIRYFNIMLGSQLLYKFERLQYSELLNLKKDVCDLYGAFHLLRLLEKLDEIIEYAPLAVKPLENLLANVNDLLKYLDKESPKLFKIEDYIIAPPNYIRAAF